VLIQFSVENFRSIRERQTLNMAASRYFKDLEDANTFHAGLPGDFPRLLKSAVIYGPNAAGKTSIVEAIAFMEGMVLHSAKGSQAGEKIEVAPFALSASTRNADSEFEIALVADGVRYQFGFRANTERITEEWLFAFPNGHLQKWYQRAFDAPTGQYVYKFSPLFAGGRKRTDWKEQTRANALFVSTAIQLNNEQLKPFFDWFQEKIAVLGKHTALNIPFVTSGDTNSICIEDDVRRKRVVDFLNLADLSIEDLKITSHRFSADSLPEDMPPAMRDEMTRHMKDQTFHDVAFLHRDLESGELVSLDEQVESDGTRGLYAFAGPWLDVIDNDRVLIVDEIDTSLHPLIVHQLVRLLQTQGKRAQLVFTTHDTSIMSAKVMRRDQIWFVERGTAKSTRLYSLAEFSVREQEAIEKGYLGGRYGAIPLLRDLRFDG
jgi:AAA15 family ATPase/GTPase